MKTKSDIADDFATYKEVLLELGISEEMIDKRIAELRAETDAAREEMDRLGIMNSPAWR